MVFHAAFNMVCNIGAIDNVFTDVMDVASTRKCLAQRHLHEKQSQYVDAPI